MNHPALEPNWDYRDFGEPGRATAAKRDAVAHLRGVLEMSERRACSHVAADHKMIPYRSCRPPDTELHTRLRDLANQRRTFGYWRYSSCCGTRASHLVSTASTGSSRAVRKRRSRRKAEGTHAPILVEAKPNA
jgi:putative transposase